MTSTIPGNLLTTAMGVMPHTDVARALEMALSLDVPFWPQLPHYSYYEDMYVQAAEHFPGMVLDIEKRSLRFPWISSLRSSKRRCCDLTTRPSLRSARPIQRCTIVFWRWTWRIDLPFGGNLIV
jgi:hypothetical protein